MTLYKAIPLAIGLSLAALALAQAAESTTCPNPQSPRNIRPTPWPGPYNGDSRTSIVSQVTLSSIRYTPRHNTGAAQTLRLCGQHYHVPIETPQGCPSGNNWVEIHTVYASELTPGPCDPQSLNCCGGTVLVRAFAARVIPGGSPAVIVPPSGRPLAEWSGSSTGEEKEPDECKGPAQWSFRLGCNFTVSRAQLDTFTGHDPARHVQPANRLSNDLTLVRP